MPNLPRFYPAFTAPPVFSLSSVLPQFYPSLVFYAGRFPRFYPKGKTAHFLLVVGGRLIVRSGDRVLVDAVVIEGKPTLDENMLTGEPCPLL